MNRVQLTGRLEEVRQRWTPDGSFAVIAALYIERPGDLGAPRAAQHAEQPMPIRALDDWARFIATHEGQNVSIEGLLRRRFYRQDGEERWGQVEIWVQKACTVDNS